MNFNELGLSARVLSAVRATGYGAPTPIQALAIPAALGGRDVLGIAQTGTGKTGAFVLPMLNRLERGRARARMPRTLVIEPTRELAAQVADSFRSLNSEHKLAVALLIGGVPFEEQYRQLNRGADVLIATPGRLLDHFERGKILLNGIELLVIDEADRLLDMGFMPDIGEICRKLPVSRQTLFFSATMPPEIKRLTSTFLKDPARIEVSPQSSVAVTVEQSAVAAPAAPGSKREVLRNLIREATGLRNAIIFCNRKRDVATLFRSLCRHKFSACALHGDMDQRDRMETLEQFRNGERTLLIASDVAARGLDIHDVSHVFNFDVPTRAEDYVHRIGRTGRAGRVGVALTLVTPNEHKYLIALEELIKSKLTWRGDPPQAAPDTSETHESQRKPCGKQGRADGDRTRERKTRRRERAGSGPKRREEAPPASLSPVVTPKNAILPPEARKERGEDDRTPVGLGKHVPAFLLQAACFNEE